VASKGVQARGIAPVSKEYGKSQPTARALFFSLALSTKRLSLKCGSACFYLHQLRMVQRKSVITRGLGPFASPPLPLCRISLILLPAIPSSLGHALPIRWLGPLATKHRLRSLRRVPRRCCRLQRHPPQVLAPPPVVLRCQLLIHHGRHPRSEAPAASFVSASFPPAVTSAVAVGKLSRSSASAAASTSSQSCLLR